MATCLFSLIPFLLLSLQALAQTPTAPAPSSAGPVNLTGILDKNGQYTTFIRLLTTTQVANQIETQLNTSTEGMTVLAPTDNAFDNLKSDTMNNLSAQQQIQLVQYHIMPKFYTLNNLILVSNPVPTIAGNWGLNFSGKGNQVNVSTGVVETQLNNVLRQTFPLAVYQSDKVLLPEDIFGVKSPTAAPAPPAKNSSRSAGSSPAEVASEPSPANGSGRKSVALGLAIGLGLLCFAVLS
ncbi:hypothetical protein K2173_013086 [Erythroxylum novogranatense]|uniref:FAS1 domain-containing protein n=1 Tax=Erythroxylum novogranatense TaxID=1862640 RepID=A0AAV8S5S5_9ROSI|nr:hypothetical protein K2173_013086 [Erythroxylum novogranatense]